jgi:eukaryotic-like serine/threonine-protein kinase
MASLLAPGTKIGRYEILGQLGAGAMGQVYSAQDTKRERKVALKVLPSQVTATPNYTQRFILEAKAAAGLNHPNIAHIYEAGETEGVNYIAMEFIDGETLRTHLGLGSMNISQVLEISAQIASALSAAHERGIVHRSEARKRDAYSRGLSKNCGLRACETLRDSFG